MQAGHSFHCCLFVLLFLLLLKFSFFPIPVCWQCFCVPVDNFLTQGRLTQCVFLVWSVVVYCCQFLFFWNCCFLFCLLFFVCWQRFVVLVDNFSPQGRVTQCKQATDSIVDNIFLFLFILFVAVSFCFFVCFSSFGNALLFQWIS